jgi:hypothetical protein
MLYNLMPMHHSSIIMNIVSMTIHAYYLSTKSSYNRSKPIQITFSLHELMHAIIIFKIT